MSINVIEIYEDVVKDTVDADQNGQLTYEQFSRLSKRAELSLIDWLSGGVDNIRLPIPWISQKNKDWLSPFISTKEYQIQDSSCNKPDNYYQWENFYRIGSRALSECEEDVLDDECDTPIELVDGDEYNDRCKTNIEELKPNINNPICKLVGNQIVIMPKNIGSVKLEYIREPKFASITSKVEETYNEDVPDVAVNYEWGEWARPFLVWLISDMYSNKTREQALKQMNAASNPKQ